MATVLVIDDSPSDRQLSETLLKYGGHEVLLAADGQAGLALVKARTPDLVITDLITPTIDGYELARSVRSDPATARIPIILITAHYLDGEVRRLAAHIGIQQVIIKPYDPQVFLDAVATALTGTATPDKGNRQSTTAAFHFEHLKLVSAKLHEKVHDLEVMRLQRSEYLASMGTEMQTDLQSILGASQRLAADGSRKVDEPDQKILLGEITTNSRRLIGMVDDVLELSRADSGQVSLRVEEVTVADVVNAVMHRIAPIAARKSVHIHGDAASMGQVPADLYKLTQVLLSLASNAVGATPAGGTVSLAARRKSDSVEVSVSDSAPAIGPSERARMFVDLSGFGGSGRSANQRTKRLRLGLSRRYIELHGGTLSFARSAGRNIFTIGLPSKTNLAGTGGKPGLGIRLLRRGMTLRKPGPAVDADEMLVEPFVVAATVADIRKGRATLAPA
jgi:two-component system, sensor histidine kinase and response regulator